MVSVRFVVFATFNIRLQAKCRRNAVFAGGIFSHPLRDLRPVATPSLLKRGRMCTPDHWSKMRELRMPKGCSVWDE